MGTKCTPLIALKPSSGLTLLLVFVCIKSSSFAFGVGLSNKHFDRKKITQDKFIDGKFNWHSKIGTVNDISKIFEDCQYRARGLL